MDKFEPKESEPNIDAGVVSFDPRIRNINLELVNENCFHSMTCPQKDFCVCSGHFRKDSSLVHHPELFIKEENNNYWVCCKQNRNMAYPKEVNKCR